ncbi:hypothetical protein ACXDF8_14930 [Mycolicibacterium sp. CBM1]
MTSTLDLPTSRLAGTLPVTAPPRPARHRKRIRPSAGHLLRVALFVALVLVAFGGSFYRTALSIAGGSPLAYLAVLPLLLAMIAVGCAAPPRGVGDAEADWILAALVGGLGLVLHFQLESRLPTLSGLWRLPLIGAVIWAAVAATVLFGVRRVAVKWPAWLFAIATVTPLPYLMATAWLGGSPVATSSVAALIGATAVYLAGRQHPLQWRLAAATVCAVLGLGAAVTLAGWPLLVSVTVSAGAVPLLTFVALETAMGGRPSHPHAETTPLPRRSPLSLGLLAAVACLLLVLDIPRSAAAQPPPQARPDWVSVMGLQPSRKFDFVTRYLGPDATFVRYTVPTQEGYPQAAVDVITADDLATLRAYRDVVWYPVSVMPNYTALDSKSPVVKDIRAAASDSSANTEAAARQWYTATWIWRTGDRYQQVLVVLNQDPTSQAPPPPPEPISLHDTVAAPALWLTRQQADPSGEVDPEVTDRAHQIIAEVLSAGAARRG